MTAVGTDLPDTETKICSLGTSQHITVVFLFNHTAASYVWTRTIERIAAAAQASEPVVGRLLAVRQSVRECGNNIYLVHDRAPSDSSRSMAWMASSIS
jgi:hypothetical protein